MDKRATPAKQVTSLTWGPPPPCNRPLVIFCHGVNTIKLSQVKISTCEVIILSSENSSDTCVFFFTLFNEFITGCIPQVTGTQQVWDVTYCNQPITTFNA